MLSDAALKGYWGELIQPGMIGFGTETVSACMGDSGSSMISMQSTTLAMNIRTPKKKC